MELKNFQKEAIKKLKEAMSDVAVHEIILKSPTGSGKTIILTHFMSEYVKDNPNVVFMWLTPGKGELEVQSKDKMDKYIHNASTKLLCDVMNGDFESGDSCFINWEKLIKKGNTALKEGERENFKEKVQKALNEGLSFKIIIDEGHENFTAKADEIVQLFKSDKVIRSSATPHPDKKAHLIEIKEADVIAEGLIKKYLIINENFPSSLHFENENEDQTSYLIDRAVQKRNDILGLLHSKGSNVNPLIIVQLPNNSVRLEEEVEEHFKKLNITVQNGLFAIWLSKRHENIENISKNDALPIAVMMKQAVATGWDCPRAYILVKLRENMDETFEVQTIGRIRRMSEAHHYENDTLDSCYLYTFDKKFTEGVKSTLGKDALDAKEIFLKNEYKSFKIMAEQRSGVDDLKINSRKLCETLKAYLKNTFDLKNSTKENQTRLEANGFSFSHTVDTTTASGSVSTLSDLNNENKLSTVTVSTKLNSSRLGREFHRATDTIGGEIGLDYSVSRTIVNRLFSEKFGMQGKILSLSFSDLYIFVINNKDLLRRNFREALAREYEKTQRDANIEKIFIPKEISIPHTFLFTYDANSKVQMESKKNVYKGYLLSASPRSSAEKKFEKFSEECPAVDWIYKNGDKGSEYFSIMYGDNADKYKLFYPDYILSVKGETWIIETKGGFDSTGESEDIDIFSPKKFKALKRYLEDHKLKGGFVRFDEKSNELCICTDVYSDDITSRNWQLLKDVLK